MSKIEILFFAADPLSTLANGGADKLSLDEEAREIRERVHAADRRERLDFQSRWAVRTADLTRTLRERRPQVVHFSGHGGSDGLILVGKDGRAHPVSETALARLFRTYRDDIRLVVLNACFSEPQAKAIADAVGCAIGTRGQISDEAAITFAAEFYSGIACGESVAAAYEGAAALLDLDRIAEEQWPKLLHRDDVDPAALFLTPSHPSADAPSDASPRPLAGLPRPSITTAPMGAAGTSSMRGRDWLVAALVWGMSAAAAMVLGVGLAWALGLSVAPLAITAGLLRYARSSAPGLMRPGYAAGIAVLLSATAVVAGTIAIPPPAAIVAPAQCARGGTSRLLGLSAPAAASAGTDDAADMASAKSLYEAGKYDEAFPVFKLAAEAGDPEAMGYLAMAYLCGQGTALRPELAVPWLDQAKTTRDPRGMNALGIAYETGRGQNHSDRWAKHWYRESADAGFVDAMRNLGNLHLEEHPDSALIWFDSAGRMGSLDAVVDAGRVYEQGLVGGRRNPDEAIRRYRQAAEAGSPRGMLALGRMHQEGTGVPQSYDSARALYQRAAGAGFADAMNNLGILHQNGWGVPKSRSEAIRWYRQAADAGSTEARSNLAALEGGWRAFFRRWTGR